MGDFTLSIRKYPSGLTIMATGEKQAKLELPALTGLQGTEAGRQLYQQVFAGPVLTAYQATEPDRVLIYGSGEVLDWPWQRLHDGVLPLALRHPLVLLPAERELAPAPDVAIEDVRLRVLLTQTPDAEHAGLGVAIDQWIEQLEQRYAQQIYVRRVKLTGGYQGLLRIFQQAEFHLWQHVGPCNDELALRLGEEEVRVSALNKLLALQRAGCCMMLATHGEMPPASLLSQLNAPFVLCQAARPGSEGDLKLLRGFYERLLTHDLASAGTLGQLETYLEDDARGGWGKLTMVAQTAQLFLDVPQLEMEPEGERVLAQVPVLVLKANPRGVPKLVALRIDQEIREIKAVLRENRGVLNLQEEGAVRKRDLSVHLSRYRPVLLHFSGHGTEQGELVLVKDASLQELREGIQSITGPVDDIDYVEFIDIARILAEYRATLRCVVLNACSTEPLAEAICAAIPCAIGMRGKINDVLAIRFAEIFYRALIMGESVGLAFRKARADVLSNANAREETFQLKCRTGVNPHEVYIVSGRGGQL